MSAHSEHVEALKQIHKDRRYWDTETGKAIEAAELALVSGDFQRAHILAILANAWGADGLTSALYRIEQSLEGIRENLRNFEGYVDNER